MKFNDSYTYKFRKMYSNLPDKAKKIKKYYAIFILLGLTIYILLNIFSKIQTRDIIFYSLKVIFVTSITYFIIKLLYTIFDYIYGEEIRLEYQRDLTREYVTEKAPKKIKFWGYTGAGKDSTVSGFTTFVIEELKSKAYDEMFKIKRIIFLFDFNLVDSYIDKNYKNYIYKSRISNKKTFMEDFKKNKGFIKERYLINKDYYNILLEKGVEINEKMIEIDSFINRYYEIKDNLRNNNDYYIISDGINYSHVIDELFKYIILYIRINYVDNFVLSNQPFEEEQGKMAKIYSFDMMKTKEEIINVNGRKFKRKVVFPWIEYLCIVETEVDAWLSNIDEDARSSIKTGGIRNFKAFSRHLLGENIYHYQIGQTATRSEKSLRELDHAFSRIYQIDKVYGGTRRISKCQKKISKIESKKKQNDKRIEKISKLTIKLNTLLMSGYLRISLVMNRSDQLISGEDIRLENLVNLERPKENYKTVLTFKMSDCWGKNNTHYLNFLAEKLNNLSVIQFAEIPSWSNDLLMNKENALFMNYDVLNNMYGFSKEELLQKHYEPLGEDKK